MAHQIMFTLTDQEYETFSAEAARSGKPLDTVLHEALVPPMQHSVLPLPADIVVRNLYQKGIIMNIATHEPLTAQEDALLHQLAVKLGKGQPMSEMVIDDRGPRD